jgi:hypothetical protein
VTLPCGKVTLKPLLHQRSLGLLGRTLLLLQSVPLLLLVQGDLTLAYRILPRSRLGDKAEPVHRDSPLLFRQGFDRKLRFRQVPMSVTERVRGDDELPVSTLLLHGVKHILTLGVFELGSVALGRGCLEPLLEGQLVQMKTLELRIKLFLFFSTIVVLEVG